MTRRRASSHPLLVLLAWSAVLAPVALLRGAEPPPPVSIYFESQVPYVYEDDPIMVAVPLLPATPAAVPALGHWSLTLLSLLFAGLLAGGWRAPRS